MRLNQHAKFHFPRFATIACLLLIFSFAIPQSSQAQLNVTPGGTAASLAQEITGNGVQIFNATLIAPTGSYGTYTANVPSLGTSQGVILTTGNAVNAIGPNNTESKTTEHNAAGSSLLSQIIGYPTFDAVVLEFDLIPKGDTLRFNFTFASEEYQEYVGTPFNDAFGFFISGPGISGDAGLGNLHNIALIPGTSTPVSINNVNNGNPSTGYPAQNSQYYHNNPLNLNAQVQYDGWTQNLYAQAIVTPCDTFHLKLVIADGGDDEWDSGVLIDKIETNSVTLASNTAEGTPYMIEGCNDGTVTFTRSPITDQPLTVNYFIGGTAINGTDYPLIGTDPDPLVPKQIVIPANQATSTITISPYADGITEGQEYVSIYLGNPACVTSISDSLQFFIRDSLGVSIDPPSTDLCLGDSLMLSAISDANSFSWSPASTLTSDTGQTVTAFPTDSTTYQVTANLGACNSTALATVNVNQLFVSFSVQNVICAGDSTGSITATPSGGSPPFTFNWIGPNGTSFSGQTINNLTAGTYILTVGSRAGCTITDTAVVTSNPPIQISLNSPTYSGGNNVSCSASTDGSITATISGGVAPYTYQWNDPANSTTAAISGLPAGTYTITVTDASGCQQTASITLTAPEPLGFNISSQQNVACSGSNSGSTTVQATGGTPNYTYVWNTVPAQFGPTANNLSAGSYQVNITDANGCTFSGTVTITQPDSALNISVSSTPVSCNGNQNGSATVTASGGVAPYSYQWNTNPVQTTATATNLAAGSYMVTVTDANGCTQNASVLISQPPVLQVSVLTQQNISCFGDSSASITANATGGTAPYSYTWNTNPPQTGATISGLPAGTYTVSVTDAAGCSQDLSVTVTQPDQPLSIVANSIISPACHNGTDGSISVSANGGTAPYTYSWNTVPPQTTDSIGGLSSGNYSVVVTDAGGCSTSATYTLNNPTQLQANISNIQNVLCFGDSSGSATVSVSGGTPPYSYQWDDPGNQTTSTANNLSAGTYHVLVTDSAGCSGLLTVTITQPSAALSVQLISEVDATCPDGQNGSATVQASGGSGSYSYHWNDPQQQTGATATGLSAGTYIVTVVDNNGCGTPVTLSVTIGAPGDLVLNFNAPSSLACNGDTTATINLTVTGGTSPYSYQWTLPGGAIDTTQDIINAHAGTYVVQVTDSNGCTLAGSVTITQPSPIVINYSSTPSDCFGQATGSITTSISGGVPPYNISWTGPNGFTSSDTSLTNLSGGTYVLTVTDSNGCTKIQPVTVTQPQDLIISVDSLSQFIGGWNVSCSYSQNGSIAISASGGQPPYSYSWNTSGMAGFDSTSSVSNLPAGQYEVVVSDNNGCIQSQNVVLSAPDTLHPGLQVNGNLACFGDSTVSIVSSVAGGTPGYTYNWSGTNGFTSTTPNLSLIGSGTYQLQVTDTNGCVANAQVAVTSPDSISLSLNTSTYSGGVNISCADASNGSVQAVVGGGTAPFSFNWIGPNGFSDTTSSINNLGPGQYCVTVTDASGCSKQACVTLTAPDTIGIVLSPSLFPNGFNVSCSNAADGSISSSVSGGTMPYTYSWSGPGVFTSDSSNLTSLEPGTYCLTILDANGCSKTTCVTLTSPPPIVIALNNTGAINCAGDSSGAITAVVSGGYGSLAYSWSGPNGFSDTTLNISNLAPGSYCLTVTDSAGCMATECAQVTQPDTISVSLSASVFPGGTNISCAGDSSGSISASISGGTAPYTYSWSGPNGFTSSAANLAGLAPGTYCVTVSDAHGCSKQSCITLTGPQPIMTNPVISPVNCSTPGASVNLQISGGSPPFSVNWSNGASGEVVNGFTQGTYIASISDTNGCSTADTVSIPNTQPLSIALFSPTFPGGNNLSCAQDSSGSIQLSISGDSSNSTISWTGPNGFVSNTGNLSNLTAGTYCVTVTNSLGCSADSCITLSAPDTLQPIIQLNAPVGCHNDTNGAISFSITGGTPTYTGQWTGPNGFTSSDQNISGLAPGTYCINVSDFNGCSALTCYDLVNPDTLTISLSSPTVDGFNVHCFGDTTGSVNSDVNGGTPPYSYNWSGPDGYTDTVANPSGLKAGQYCLTVTDAGGCSATSCISLTQPDSLNLQANLSMFGDFNISCAGLCNGAIGVHPINGIGPFSYQWAGSAGFSSTGDTLSNLCQDTYYLQVTDGSGCSYLRTYQITEPQQINLQVTSPVFGGGFEIGCLGDSTGTIFSQISGGNPGYQFSWTGPDGFVSNQDTLEALTAGQYFVQVVDQNGCTVTDSIELHQPSTALSASETAFVFPGGTNISCLGLMDGSINLSVSGGTGPYDYQWLGPNGFQASSQDVSQLGPGSYQCVIQDANSCVYTVVDSLIEPSTAISAQTDTVIPPACNGLGNGSISISLSGGIPGYDVQWTGPGSYEGSGLNISGLMAGSYQYSATDTNGCLATDTILVVEPEQLSISAETSNTICSAAVGSISLNVSGGTSPFAYSWNNDSTSANITGLEGGSYQVTVTDSHNCTIDSSFNIGTDYPLNVTGVVQNVLCFGQNNGSINLQIDSGTSPLTITWGGDNGYTSSDTNATGLSPGQYYYSLVDGYGCSATDTFNVSSPDSIAISLSSPLYNNGFNISYYQGSNGRLDAAEITGGVQPYDLSWTGPKGFASNTNGPFSQLSAGIYTLMVTDSNGCSVSDSILLRAPFEIALPNGISPNGDGFNDGLIVHGLEAFPDNTLKIFNRWGGEVYEEKNYSNNNPWKGVNNHGKALADGTYFVVLELKGHDALRGYLEVRR